MKKHERNYVNASNEGENLEKEFEQIKNKKAPLDFEIQRGFFIFLLNDSGQSLRLFNIPLLHQQLCI